MIVVTSEVWEMIQTPSARDINTKYILVFLIVFVATKTSEFQLTFIEWFHSQGLKFSLTYNIIWNYLVIVNPYDIIINILGKSYFKNLTRIQ